MRLSFIQMTECLSETVKQQIIQEHGETGQDLAFLLEKDYIKTIWNRLSEDEQAVIVFFLREKGHDFLTYREIEQGIGFSISPPAFKFALTKLRRLGVIFTLRRLWGELAYVMPREMTEGFRRFLVPAASSWSRAMTLPVSPSYHILDDLFQVLNYVRKKPLGLTKKGTVHKKDMKAMLDSIGWDKRRLSPLVPPQPPLPTYEQDEAIILDLLSKWGLLVQKGNQIVVGNMSWWIQSSSEYLRTKCCDLLNECVPMNPKLEFFWDIIKTLEAGTPFSLQSILEGMGEFAPGFQEVKEKLLDLYQSLGFLQKIKQEEDIFWAWRDLKGHDQPSAYIQPTFEIWLPSFSCWKLKWDLLSFSRLLKREEMWSLKFDKQTVQDFFESGRTGDDLISILHSCTKVPVPENVLSAIEDWELDFRQITFMDARILLVRSRDVAAELEKIPAVSGSLQQKLGDQAYIVRLSDWQNLKDELDKRGYASGPVIQQTTNKVDEAPGESLQVYKLSTPGSEYKVESVFPGLEDAIPGVGQIPRMWVSNFSKYHESTLRELIQKAAQMGMEVRLEWKGSDVRLIPRVLQNRDGYWILEGQLKDETCSYRLDDIGKIQILLPL